MPGTRLTIARGPSPDALGLGDIGVMFYQPATNYMRVGVGDTSRSVCGTCARSAIFQNNYQIADDIDITKAGTTCRLVASGFVTGRRASVSRTGKDLQLQRSFTNDSLADFMLGLPNNFQQGNKQAFDGRQTMLGCMSTT